MVNHGEHAMDGRRERLRSVEAEKSCWGSRQRGSWQEPAAKHGKHGHVTRRDIRLVVSVSNRLYHLTLHDHHVRGTAQTTETSRVKQGSIRRSRGLFGSTRPASASKAETTTLPALQLALFGNCTTSLDTDS